MPSGTAGTSQVLYLNELTALAVASTGGIYKYALNATALILLSNVLSANNYLAILFFPGSEGQGYAFLN